MAQWKSLHDMGLASLRWKLFLRGLFSSNSFSSFVFFVFVVDENRYEHIIRLHYLFSFQLFSEKKSSDGFIELDREKYNKKLMNIFKKCFLDHSAKSSFYLFPQLSARWVLLRIKCAPRRLRNRLIGLCALSAQPNGKRVRRMHRPCKI